MALSATAAATIGQQGLGFNDAHALMIWHTMFHAHLWMKQRTLRQRTLWPLRCTRVRHVAHASILRVSANLNFSFASHKELCVRWGEKCSGFSVCSQSKPLVSIWLIRLVLAPELRWLNVDQHSLEVSTKSEAFKGEHPVRKQSRFRYFE